jgi:2-polyprenyl-3-methyl-5-hydroxy-6-metoxy-1,4-benzoquinol methylase
MTINHLLSLPEFCEILRKHSLEVISIKGISLNIFSKKFFESSNPNINYILHCRKIND